MTTEDGESASRAGADKAKRKKKTTHNHIGPNVRAFRAGRAFCPSCDADKILRLTDKERDEEKAARDALRASGRR